ncbi:Ankyrin repeat-containing domain protein [Cordyceps fumosorosea ARSEF 2679]|uniref:Ankyrin repeat-containing domain protein n=1 Tax=Cordyceps fumosorosea (strain ARSEF 2679) TaxID=1081104 RepID=A0A167S638_CORFA|nr:Ankyrin repeat-containing domain protein [Cordyceps fumosorosea ARSEF 2679]OAA59296.1 Ankyrin repeat-containing domain protein [Cordyceps fumosorosea ARSEF 2679]
MEPVGLAVGVLGLSGLFSVCLEAVARFDAWKKFDGDIAFLGLRVEAERLRLDKWGLAAGFQPNSTFGNDKDDVIKSRHHVALHDKRTADIVKKLLILLRDVCAGRDGLLFLDLTGILRSGSDLTTPQNPFGISSISRRARLKWALKDKATCVARVEQIELVVQKLHDLVPSSGPLRVTDDAAAAHQQVSDDLTRVLADREDVRSAILKIEQSLNAKTRRELHSWLLGRHTPNEIFETALKRKQESTCQWILNRKEFLKWVSSDDLVAKFLWINGPAAFGKTILCSALITHLQSTLKTPVAFYFFSSDDLESRRDPFSALRLWLVQLLSNDTIFYALRGRFESSQGQAASTGDVISAFKDAVQMFPECIFVMDGLDECENGEDSCSVTDFLKTLSWVISGTRARILITSRDETAIRQGLFGTAGVAAVEYKISQKDVHPDIGKYCQAVIHEKLFGRDEKLCDDLSQKMAKRCNGQFLWIKLQGSRLSRYKSAAKLEAEIDKTPSGLDHLYDRNWGIIEKREPAARERAYAMMRWEAVSFGNIDMAKVLLNAGADIFAQDKDGRTALHAASLMGRLELMQVFLDRGVDVNVRDSLNRTPLHEAACNSDARAVQILLKRGADRRAQDKKAKTALHVGSLAGRLDVVRSLLKQSVEPDDGNSLQSHATSEVDARAKNDWTPIHFAAAAGFADIVQVLIDFGADISATDDLGNTPSHFAAVRGQADVIRILGKHGSRFSVHNNDGYSPLDFASRQGHVNVVEAILEQELSAADIDQVSGDNITSMHAACIMGHVEIVKLLLQAGADPENQHDPDSNPIIAACINGHSELVQLLLAAGADLGVTNSAKQTPLHVASLHGFTEVVYLLLEGGADPAALDDHRFTPAFHAARGGHASMLRLQLDAGANIHATDINGNTLFHVSVPHAAVVELLVEKGLDINAVSAKGYTPLHVAAVLGHVPAVKLLLENGASLEIKDGQANNALMLAAQYGHAEVARLCIESGTDVDAVDLDGFTALAIAAGRGHATIVELLLAGGVDLRRKAIAKLLLERGVDVGGTETGGNGTTALSAASFGGHATTVALLLERGANVEPEGISEGTPLLAAALQGQVEVARLLLDHGAQVDAAIDGGYTPLSIATHAGHLTMARLLVEVGGARVDLCTVDGRTPLMVASTGGRAAIVELLLSGRRGAAADYVDARDRHGQTAFSLAVRCGARATARALRATGVVDLLSEDKYGRTPLCWARRLGYADMEEFLAADDGGAEDGKLLAYGTGDDPGPLVCHVCLLPVPEDMSFGICEVCPTFSGRFSVCHECYELGARCADQRHSLKERPTPTQSMAELHV